MHANSVLCSRELRTRECKFNKWMSEMTTVQQRSNQMQMTLLRANDILISWLTMQVQHKPHLLSFAKQQVWCVDMASRILLLLPRFINKTPFCICLIFERKNAVLWAMNAYLDIGSKNDKFIFDDILMRSFWGAWTCDCQT